MIPKQDLSRRRFIAGGAALAALPLLSHRSGGRRGGGGGGRGRTRRHPGPARSGNIGTHPGGKLEGRGTRPHRPRPVRGSPMTSERTGCTARGRTSFVRHAKDNGFTAYPAPDAETLYVGDRKASERASTPPTRAAYEERHPCDIGCRPSGPGRESGLGGSRRRKLARPGALRDRPVRDGQGLRRLLLRRLVELRRRKGLLLQGGLRRPGRPQRPGPRREPLDARDVHRLERKRRRGRDRPGSHPGEGVHRHRLHRGARERGHPFRPRVARRDGRCLSRHQHGRLRPHRAALRRERARHRTRRVPPVQRAHAQGRIRRH